MENLQSIYLITEQDIKVHILTDFVKVMALSSIIKDLLLTKVSWKEEFLTELDQSTEMEKRWKRLGLRELIITFCLKVSNDRFHIEILKNTQIKRILINSWSVLDISHLSTSLLKRAIWDVCLFKYNYLWLIMMFSLSLSSPMRVENDSLVKKSSFSPQLCWSLTDISIN